MTKKVIDKPKNNKGKSKKVMGRPKTKIDKDKFEALCALQCTQIEIAEQFHVCEDTLNSWCKDTYGMTYSEVFRQKRQPGFTSLRRRMYESAKTSTAMQIFLAKNWLGMSDKQDTTMSLDAQPRIDIHITDNSNLEREMYKDEEDRN